MKKVYLSSPGKNDICVVVPLAETVLPKFSDLYSRGFWFFIPDTTTVTMRFMYNGNRDADSDKFGYLESINSNIRFEAYNLGFNRFYIESSIQFRHTIFSIKCNTKGSRKGLPDIDRPKAYRLAERAAERANQYLVAAGFSGKFSVDYSYMYVGVGTPCSNASF